MATKEAARQSDAFMALGDAPDHCKTPPGDVPVPYQVLAKLGGAISVSPNVKFGGFAAVLADHSSIPEVTGDESGSGGGVKSGTHKGEVQFVEGSGSVRVNGKPVVRDKDRVTLNKGNTTGKVQNLAGSAPAGGVAADGSPAEPANPVVKMVQIEHPEPEGGTGDGTKTFSQPSSMSEEGIKWLKTLEGTIKRKGKHVLYEDSKKYATIGYGHLVKKTKIINLDDTERAPYDDGWTEDTAVEQLKKDLKWVEDGIHKNVFSDLTGNQFDALVSIGFNCGRSSLVKSSIVKSIEAADFDRAAEDIKNFKTDEELTSRRSKEAILFKNGEYYGN